MNSKPAWMKPRKHKVIGRAMIFNGRHCGWSYWRRMESGRLVHIGDEWTKPS